MQERASDSNIILNKQIQGDEKAMAITKKKVYIWALITAVLVSMPLHAALADEDEHILQAYITEQTMTVFADVELHSDELRCAVSNQGAEIISSGLLSGENVLIKTTVLVDVSTSMPSSMRGDVITALESLIEHKSKNEEFKLVAFGDEMNTLQDFSSDRYDLANAAEKIKFDGEQSKIYDAIYNTIPRISLSDKKPAFYRTVVITDGVDDTVSGITKEELFIKLQNERYPVDVVAVSAGEGAENKELSAIVRISGGRYYSLIPGTDTSSLAQTLGVSSFFYIEAKVPEALLDGTTRQADIGDGTYNMSIDVKFPVFNSANDTAPADISRQTAEQEQEIAPSPAETAAPKSNSSIFGDYTIVIFIGAGIAFVILIAIAVKSLRGKKEKASLRNDSFAMEYGGDNVYTTEFISGVNPAESQYTIKLSNSNEPNKTWTLPVNEELLIGRAEHCPVRLDDRSVSREHCKIIAQSLGLFVVHLSSTNKTSLNGSDVAGNTPLKSGDILKIGREVLHIDYIQTLGSPAPRQEQPQKNRSGNTESVF